MRLIGNDDLLEQIGIAAAGGRIPQACIVEGLSGSGKRTFARLLSAAAVCTGQNPPCGLCAGCRKAEAGIHPDIETVRRESAEIKVEQIRALRSSLHIRANEAPRRVAIIEEAGAMNENAQNALLRLIEEPPSSILVILILENKNGLLQTIRSRCSVFRMNPVPEQAIYEELARRGIPEEKARKAAGAAQGRVGKALVLAARFSENRLDGLVERVIHGLIKRDPVELSKAAVQIEKNSREQLVEQFEELRILLWEGLARKFGVAAERYPEQAEGLASKINIVRLGALEKSCRRLIGYCDANVGIGLIAGAFLSLFSEEDQT